MKRLLLCVLLCGVVAAKEDTIDDFSLTSPATVLPAISYVRTICSDGLVFKMFFDLNKALIHAIQVTEYNSSLNLVVPKSCKNTKAKRR